METKKSHRINNYPEVIYSIRLLDFLNVKNKYRFCFRYCLDQNGIKFKAKFTIIFII
jgi:hypothetical protein